MLTGKWKGGAIGHSGYELQYRDDAVTDTEVYIDINDDNLFMPGAKDRGQPKIFMSGQHIDEFEADFSMEEVKGCSVIYWSVRSASPLREYREQIELALSIYGVHHPHRSAVLLSGNGGCLSGRYKAFNDLFLLDTVFY
jgi:hypothetical protein